MTIKQEDIFKLDLSEASVVTLYLLPSLNVKLIPQLKKLKPGSRIVSHAFDMKGAKPNKVVQVQTSEGAEHTVYLWVVPWEEEKDRNPGPDAAADRGDARIAADGPCRPSRAAHRGPNPFIIIRPHPARMEDIPDGSGDHDGRRDILPRRPPASAWRRRRSSSSPA